MLLKGRTNTTDLWLLTPSPKFRLKLVWEYGKTVSELVKKHKATYGINFPYFWGVNPLADLKIGSKILCHPSAGKTLKWRGLKYNKGILTIGTYDIKEPVDEDGFLVRTSPLLVEGGKNVSDSNIKIDNTADDIAYDKRGKPIYAQRTVVGLDKKGHPMFMVTKGREGIKNPGLTLNAAANYLITKGAVMALNGDGGSSSVLANQNGIIIGSNRKVNHALLIYD